ncbi:hypothetical protein Phum_PHUM421000 [Pediculus humanus corporis]|uniref:Uncharacterized protein n=1 Tax=Pediculus humanus subsp. corporis TaxID=121224 RepID=E0VP55_PEDHC|nr:uncharacterized protein Phum_PHUM421000 [Pediculus humanus corporis]EEB15161.1 hypothetical protein Phum_PHUM351820 [Pediculus humanus corporis]EEB16394.1 hypothetical protein Phum_PHUM421000 [Pediculus humanus corporis]
MVWNAKSTAVAAVSGSFNTDRENPGDGHVEASSQIVPISAAGLQGLALRIGARRARKESGQVVRGTVQGTALGSEFGPLRTTSFATTSGRCRGLCKFVAVVSGTDVRASRFALGGGCEGKSAQGRGAAISHASRLTRRHPRRPPTNDRLRTGTDKGNPTV